MSSPAAQRVRSLTAAALAGATRAGRPAVGPGEADPAASRRRWALGPRPAAAVAAVLVAVVGGVAVTGAILRSTPEPVVVASAAPRDAPSTAAEVTVERADGAAATPSAPAAGGPSVVVVHVAGQVQRPGVVELPSGSRLHDALEAAGGATADADLAAVNLARAIVDGEQVYVPAFEEQRAPAAWAGAASSSGPDAGTSPVDLNTAGAAELDALPGIGPVLARRILDWRAEHSRFSTVDELGEVAGIGATLLERLRPLVTV